jgi:tetratricopeptide (TPR) repeat protein
LKELFLAAVALPEPRHATDIVTLADGDPLLEARLRSLLDADRRADTLFDSIPAMTDAGDIVVDRHDPASTAADATLGSPPIPGFDVGPLIGSGSVGLVYRARQHHPRRDVAIKVLRPGPASTSIVRRFRREADLLARLRHPGIAQVYGSGTLPPPDTRPYIVLELVHGTPLIDRARQVGLAAPDRLLLLADLADATHHAHTQGVLHRDLKPAHVLLDEQGRLRVLDFGIAALLGPEHNSMTTDPAASLIGTIGWMSPEALGIIDHPVDTRSDLYAIGVIAFELLCGTEPFPLDHAASPAAAMASVIDRVRRTDTRFPTTRGVGPDVRAILAKAMALHPASRYQSAAELADDFRRARDGLPVHARRLRPAESAARFVRRHPIAFAAAATAALLSILGVARIAAEQRRAERHLESAIRTADVLLNEAIDHLGPLTGSAAERAAIVAQLEQTLPDLARARPRDARLALGVVRLHAAQADLATEALDHARALRLRTDALAALDSLASRPATTRRDDLPRMRSILHIQIGDSLRALGRAPDAIDHYRHAQTLDQARAHADPTDLRAADDLFWSHQRLAANLADVDPDQAMHALVAQEASAIRLRALRPDHPGTLFAILQTLSDVRREESVSSLLTEYGVQARVDLARELIRRSPANRGHRLLAAGTLLTAALDLAHAGQHDAAAALADDAAAHQLVVRALDPTAASLITTDSHLLRVRAELARARGSFLQAADLQRQAISLLSTGLGPAPAPPSPAHAMRLASEHAHLAILLAEAADPPGAHHAVDDAISLAVTAFESSPDLPHDLPRLVLNLLAAQLRLAPDTQPAPRQRDPNSDVLHPDPPIARLIDAVQSASLRQPDARAVIRSIQALSKYHDPSGPAALAATADDLNPTHPALAATLRAAAVRSRTRQDAKTSDTHDRW